MLTGLDDETVAAETLQAGGQDYLNKGALNSVLLHQSIRNAIERKRAEEDRPPLPREVDRGRSPASGTNSWPC